MVPSPVVVVDYECATALGMTFDDTWRALLSGESGIREITRYAATEAVWSDLGETPYGGQLPVSIEELAGTPTKLRKWPEPAFHVVPDVCERLARRVGLDSTAYDPQRIGMIGGTALTAQASHDALHRLSKPNVNFILNQCHNMPLAAAAMRLNVKGPSFSIGSACASSGHAIYVAERLIRAGVVDAVVVVGFEFPILPVCVAGFAWLHALYKRVGRDDRAYHDPAKASRPFSRDRAGFVPAEAASALLLADRSFATRAGWAVRGAILGSCANSDAEHMTRGSAANIEACIRGALVASAVGPEEIGCISAHAASTSAGDEAELRALNNVFGARLADVSVVANKSQIGHSLGAAAGLSTMFALQGMRDGVAAPTLNHAPDPELPPVVLRDQHAPWSHDRALVNAFGFGGTNVSLVVSLL